MKREEFFTQLRREISNLPYEEVEKTITYYEEIISDRMEEGASEDDAVSSLGSPQTIARDLQANQPFSTIIKRKVEDFRKNDSQNTALIVILLVLGFPLWFPLLMTGLSLFVGAFALMGGLVVAFWGASIAIGVGGIGCLIGSPLGFMFSGVPTGFFSIGAGIGLLGVSILAIIASIYATKGIIKLAGLFIHAIKKLFVRRA